MDDASRELLLVTVHPERGRTRANGVEGHDRSRKYQTARVK